MAMTSFPGNSAAHSRHRERLAGFTLAELLTVMGIIAMVGALSASAYQVARRNYALPASAGRIQGIMRAARNNAILTASETFVVVDPASRTATAQAFERVGEWSFEAAAGGEDGEASSLNVRREVIQGAKAVPGRIGSGLSFQGQGSFVDCGSEARFDLRTGILITAWVRHDLVAPVKPTLKEARPERQTNVRGGRRTARQLLDPDAAPASVIVRKEGAYGLGMAKDGALEGTVGAYAVRTGGGVVLPGRWVHVAFRYDGKSIELEADGVPRKAYPVSEGRGAAPAKDPGAPLAAPVTPAALTISSAALPFPGDIDEVKLAGSTEPVAYTWPPHEHVLGWKKVIRFDRRGHLDPAHHAGGVRLVLVEVPDEEKGPVTSVAVDYSLTFAEWAAKFVQTAPPAKKGAPPPVLSEAEEEAKVEKAYAAARKVEIEVDRLGVVR
jgi:Tfp pilus assembly protein FimT